MRNETPLRMVRALLAKHGWILSRIRGSHHVFTKEGETPISIPVHRNKVKAAYVRKIEKIIGAADGG